MPLDFMSADLPAGYRSTAACCHTKIQKDFRVIWVADCNYVIRFYVRRQPKDTRRPPSHKNSKEMADILIWLLILGYIGPLILIMLLDFRSAAPPAVKGSPAARHKTKFKRDDRYMVMGVDFGVIWVADFNNVIRFYVRRRPKDTRRPPSHQISKEMTRYIFMGIDFGVIRVAYFNNVIRFYVRLPAR